MIVFYLIFISLAAIALLMARLTGEVAWPWPLCVAPLIALITWAIAWRWIHRRQF